MDVAGGNRKAFSLSIYTSSMEEFEQENQAAAHFKLELQGKSCVAYWIRENQHLWTHNKSHVIAGNEL